MKGFAVLAMLFTLATACVTAEDKAPEVSPAGAEAVLTEERAALSGPIEVNDFCEEQQIACAEPCLELFGNGRAACLRQCYREYQECIGD